MRVRYLLTSAASMLPFWVLNLLSRHLPIYYDDSGWPIWLDAHYFRYCRFDIRLW